MKKFLIAFVSILSVALLQAQTCVGTFGFQLFDPKTKKPVTENLQKTVIYAFTIDEMEFYDNIEPVVPIDSVLAKRKVYTVKVNEKGYGLFPGSDPSSVNFATRCGLYLVHIDFMGENDTMSLGFYNIPAHQSFEIDSVTFKKGKYYIDFQASSRLHHFKFLDDKGYFLIPHDEIKPFEKKKEDE